MSSADDKTATVIPLPLSPPPLTTARLGLKKPPFGRPAGALTVAEMTERISRDVGCAATAEIDRKHGELRVELAAELKGASSLALAAIAMNAVALVAILASSHVSPARVLGLALAVLTAGVVGAVRLGGRRRAAAAPSR